MRTVIIIDDEPLIRRGLESMLSWEEMGYQLVAQASNGEDGLEKIRQWKPDIVFTDIKMPKMDGISMMKEVLKEEQTPVFIVLSGYNDYELVRSAMRLGAIDYLMKLNLEEEDMLRVLKEATQLLEEKHRETAVQKEGDDLKEHLIQELLQMRTDKELYEKMSQKEVALKDGYSYRLICLKLGEYTQGASTALTQNFLVNLCKEQIPEGIEVFEYQIEENAAALYLEYRGVLAKDVLYERCISMEERIKQYLNQEIRIGISASHHNIMHLSEAWDEALQSIAFHISGVGKKVHFYTDLLNVAYFEKQLEELKADADFADNMENFLLQFQKFVSQRALPEEAVHICCKLMNMINEIDSNSGPFFDAWFGKQYRTSNDFADLKETEQLGQWVLRLEQGIISYSQQYMREIYRYKVKKAKQYIEENRFQRISLNEVAAELEITPGYLSRIFKKVTQKSFSDYVAEIKMEEAKKLLLEDNNRIYEVSSMLGYDDPYYFSKVFKRVTQMTPSEYIARH